MREIKFRAWIDNEMFYINDELYISFFNAEGAVDWAIYNRFDEGCFYKHDSSYPEIYQNNWLMQYTGLKDKNGKEIYEGDIVKHNKNIFQIIHSDNQHVLVLRDIKLVTNWRDLNWCYNVRKYIEIIGNIHENKDLLT